MALLGLLSRLAHKRALGLIVGHVDHGLRPQAAAEAQQVRALAASLGLPCEVTRIAIAPGPDLAARARDLRRAALKDIGARRAAAWLALGHTATDQVETVLLHLTRGAGLAGLGGMHPARGELLRPLLGMSRAQARRLAVLMELPFADDPSNDDTEHPRVRVRVEVLPQLRRLNPSLEHTVSEALMQVRDAADLVRDLARAALEAQLVAAGPAHGEMPPGRRLRAEGWRAIPPVVRLQALRDFCTAEGVDGAELAVVALKDADAALCEWDAHLDPGGAATTPGGARARVFCVHPQRRLCVNRWGLQVESAGEGAAATP